ncbi:MAG: YggS family pyridoxal phosphate-dependent enzyme [Endomicrobium sp.]|jgi:pyridoxal phosphate enzyme (YggS family)|nr:YggS family pyridoxal phosphate-dependent enzyme [Endomicrobium sp.]
MLVKRIGNICENIKLIKNTINAVKRGSGTVDVMAVTKSFSCHDAIEALKCGIEHIGESKIQEALPKFTQLGISLNSVTKHFIGHLQSNKIKKVVENFDLIHSLDNIKYACDINRYASSVGKVQDCLIEVKVSKEATKIGVNPDNVKDFYRQCQSIPNILIKGLMVITPYSDNSEHSRVHFMKVRSLFEDIRASVGNSCFNTLSMGMSGDYKIAVQEGATVVRIGSAIFGERNYEDR